MTCDDVRQAVYVYLDDEFAAPEAEAFRRHMEGCSDCGALVRGEAAFLAHVQASLEPPDLSEAFEARVLAALDGAPAPERLPEVAPARVSWAAAPLALAAGALLALGAWNLIPAMDSADLSVRHAVAAHQTAMPPEVTGGEETVRRFVQANVPFAASVPFQSNDGLQLVGARLTQVDGRVAVIYQYDKGGQRVSVLQAAAPATVSSRLDHRQGYGILTFGDRGLHHAVVGRLPEREMRGLVPVAYRP